MTTADNLAALLARFYARRRFGIRPGLDVEKALLEKLGHPETAYPIVHVAGTNGKGSVCACLASILRTAGFKTALYTSPHLIRFSERIQVDGVEIPDADFARLAVRVEEASAAVEKELGTEPTFFEVATALGYLWFQEQRVQAAVIETGMGGRLDATTASPAILAVITRISLEHREYLGPDLPSIAGEKAGIIRPGRPVVCGAMPEEARDIIRRRAGERRAPFVDAAACVTLRVLKEDMDGLKAHAATAARDYGTLRLPLAGRFQAENLATVLAATDVLIDQCGVALDETTVKQGLARTCWPGRCHVLSRDPLVLTDGAHNPGASEMLAASLRKLVGRRKLGLIVGMCGDKDARGFFEPWAGLAARAWLVPIRNERNMPMDQLRQAAAPLRCPLVEATLDQALADAAAWARTEGGAVCATGSLFLVGEVLARERKST